MPLDVLHKAAQGVTAETIPPTSGDTGLLYPGSAENRKGSTVTGYQSSPGINTVSWSNAGNITASSGEATVTRNDEYVSHILRGFNFGLGALIPVGADIDGFEFETRARASSSGNFFINVGTVDSPEPFMIIDDGGLTGKGGTPGGFHIGLSTSHVVYTRGGSTELFGTTWTRDELISSAFGFGVRASVESDTGTIYVSRVRMKVYYSTPEVNKFELDGTAVEGNRTLVAAGAVDGTEYPYRVEEEGVGWEVGKGIFRSGTPNYIERNTPLLSSEVDNSMVTFGAGAVLHVDLVGDLVNIKEAFGV